MGDGGAVREVIMTTGSLKIKNFQEYTWFACLSFDADFSSALPQRLMSC